MTTITQILYAFSKRLPLFREGLTSNFQSTGTLNRILQMEDDDEYDEDGDAIMKDGDEDSAEGSKIKGPKLEKVLDDDEFLSELRQKNEHLHK